MAVLVAVLLTAGGAQAPAAALSPQLAARFSEGVAALEANDLARAEAAFKAVLAAGGTRAFVHHNLGIVQQRRGQHAAAIREFRAASALDPAFGPSRLLAGTSLLELGRVKEAAGELTRAVQLMPAEVSAHLKLAEASERGGDVPALADAYRRIVELAPANHEYRYRLGKAYLRLAQWSVERMQAVAPETARLRQTLGQAYLEQGRLEPARAAFEDAARRDPTLPGIHLALARIHLDGGRWPEAAREVELELALVPESAAAKALKTRIEAARAGR